MDSDHFPLPQEFAAMMLGARRPTVTIATSTLQKAGLITYHRGQLTIGVRVVEPSRAACLSQRGQRCRRSALSALQPSLHPFFRLNF